MQKIRGLLTNSTFFVLVTFIEATAPFLLAPVLTRYLTLYEYGLWAIFQSASSLLRPLLSLALEDYIRIHYHRHGGRIIVQFVIMAFAISLITTVIALTLAIIWGGSLSSLLLFPAGSLWTIILCAFLYAIFYIALAYHQFADHKEAYVFTQLAQAGVTLLGTVMLVMFAHVGWHGAVAGKLIGLAIGCAVGGAYLRKSTAEMPRALHWNHVPRLLSFGLRYLPSMLLPASFIAVDRIMLAHMSSIETASIYSVASLFPAVLSIAIQGFQLGWQPWCFSRLTSRPVPWNEISAGAVFFMLILPVGGLILYYVALLLGPLIVGNAFQPVFRYIFILIAAMVMQGYFTVAQSFLQYYQKIVTLSLLGFLVLFCKVALNYRLIPADGIYGVGLSMAISYLLGFAIALAIIAVEIRRASGKALP